MPKEFIIKAQKLLKKIIILSGNKEAENSALGVVIGFQKVNGLVADLGGV